MPCFPVIIHPWSDRPCHTYPYKFRIAFTRICLRSNKQTLRGLENPPSLVYQVGCEDGVEDSAMAIIWSRIMRR